MVKSENLPASLAMDGAILIDKASGNSSFAVIENLQQIMIAQTGLRKRDLPKLGHGGTLDPFATGLLAVCMGQGVKLARYFLGSIKTYRGVIRFGQTTIPGDPTSPVTETSPVIPDSIATLREWAHRMTLQDYLQTPPMHSAKKKDGKPLYLLAREGIEIEREPKVCRLHRFEIKDYTPPFATIQVACSSGTYIRTLAQDFSKLLGTVGMLESLDREASGPFSKVKSLTVEAIRAEIQAGRNWDELRNWVPFNELMIGYSRAEATASEALSLVQGKQSVLFDIMKRVEPSPVNFDADPSCVAIFHEQKLTAIARRQDQVWGIERVINRELD